jgi:hypothetical protein
MIGVADGIRDWERRIALGAERASFTSRRAPGGRSVGK